MRWSVKIPIYFSYLATILLIVPGTRGPANDQIDFNRDIRPILSDRCFGCHGPSVEDRQAELRFDISEDKEGPFRDRGGYQVLKPRDLQGSAIWQRITSLDPEVAMPPANSHQQPLSAPEKLLIKKWILQGASYADFWAFVPPRSQSLPEITRHPRSANRVDHFVIAQLDQRGLRPQARADKRTLIRRITFDLTGLPPTRTEIHSFVTDLSSQAYERLVDRLLARPRYGEHMAKYWLDLVHFADTNGMHHDHYREMTPYRDWVMRAFNDNLPFHQFLTFQLAGDLYEKPTLDQQIASGFQRLHLVIDSGTALPKESFHRNVLDRVVTFGTAIMGLTVQCAGCHDHKFDPITQKDFYQLYAFFNNIDASPETPGAKTHAPFIQFATAEQKMELERLQAQITETQTKINALQQSLQQLQKETNESTDTPSKLQAKSNANLKTAKDLLKRLIHDQNKLQSMIPVTLVMKEREEIRPTHIRIRGNYDQLGELVQRNTPAFLPPMSPSTEVKTRMDLAKWVTDASHPLVARVTVNRFWQQLFGQGLVKTSEDFGGQGEWPSHPKLLDDLAVELVNSNWNIKRLIQSLVTSETYRQSSRMNPESSAADPENRLLARGPRFRLDSEMIRDQILAVSGLLVSNMYGKSVKPPQPANLWKSVSMVSSSTYAFTPDVGNNIYRRSVYSFWKRAMPPPQMTIFDAPTRESCTARRERTNTPLQALVLMNEDQYFKAARNFSLQILAHEKMTTPERISCAYESVTSHVPDESEASTLLAGLKAFQTAYQQDFPAAKALTLDIETLDKQQRIDVAAYTMLVHSLFNLDITKTKE